MPLIEFFEKTGNNIILRNGLSQHQGDWARDPALVSRTSKALPTHRPLLTTNVFSLDPNQLYAWAEWAHEASLTGDRSLIKFLAPALDDQRLAIHPHEAQLSNIVPRKRVSEHAVSATEHSSQAAKVRGEELLMPLGLLLGWPGDCAKRKSKP